MADKSVFLGLCLLFVSPVISLDLSHTNRFRRQTDNTDDAKKVLQIARFSSTELGEKLKELLEKVYSDSQEKPDGLWEQDSFRNLFDSLDDLAERLPENLDDFDISTFVRQAVPAVQQAALNPCLRNPMQLRNFLLDVHKAMLEMQEELLEKLQDDSGEQNQPSTDGPLTVSNPRQDESDDVTTSPSSKDIGDDSEVDAAKTDDSRERNEFNLQELFEDLSEESMKCVSAFLDDTDEGYLCRLFSHQSRTVFAAYIQSRADCLKHLEKDDDIDDDHQEVLLKTLMVQKPTANWTNDDFRRALSLAPSIIDDDFLENINDDLIENNLNLLGRLAVHHSSSPTLQLALRRRILAQRDLSQLDSSDISKLGRGLLTLSEDLLDDFNPAALLEAQIDKIFDSDDDEDTHKDVNSRDDDDDDGLRLALGHRMQQATVATPRELGKITRLLYDDVDFLKTVDADDLFKAVEELTGLDLDDDEAANLFQKLSQSSHFPSLTQFSSANIRRLNGILPGMQLSQLQQLPRSVLRESLDDLKEISFGESQARELLEELFDVEPKDFSADDLRRVGRLVRGLDAEDIENLKDNVVEDLLDDLDDLDLSDVQKKLIVDKARQTLVSQQGANRLLRLPHLVQTLSVDDIDDLDGNSIMTSFNVTTRTSWRISQATSLLDRVKRAPGRRRLRSSDVPLLGKLAVGLLPSDLDDLISKPEDVDDLANSLDDHLDDLSSSQIDDVLEKIVDKDKIEDILQVKLTADVIAQQGSFLAYLPVTQFEKLEFDDDGKRAFVTLLSKMSTSKLPRSQLSFLAEKLWDMIEDKIEDDDASDTRKLRLLGEFSLGLSAERIRQIRSPAILNNLRQLGTMPFTRGQARAILDKLEDASPEWECKTGLLASVGPLIQFADEDKIEKLCEKELASSFASIERRMERHLQHVKERQEEGLWREDDFDDTPDVPDVLDDLTEDDIGKKLLVTQMLLAATSSASNNNKRLRRAANQLNCSVLRLTRQDVVLVGAERINAMSDSEFRDCLELIGNGTRWDRKDLSSLLARAIQVIGTPSSWTNELIRRVGVLVSALTPMEVRQLRFTGVDSLHSIAKHRRLNNEQLVSGFSQWLELKKSNTVSGITTGEFSSLSEFVCGLTTEQIKALPHSVFKQSLDVIGRARSCSAQQLEAYANIALLVYGQSIASWSPAVVGDLGLILSGLPASQIQKLTSDQLSVIHPSVIPELPVSTIKELTDVQLKQLSTNQVNAMTRTQYLALNSTQRKLLDSKATVAFLKSSEVETTPGSKPGSDQTTFVPATLLPGKLSTTSGIANISPLIQSSETTERFASASSTQKTIHTSKEVPDLTTSGIPAKDVATASKQPSVPGSENSISNQTSLPGSKIPITTHSSHDDIAGQELTTKRGVDGPVAMTLATPVEDCQLHDHKANAQGKMAGSGGSSIHWSWAMSSLLAVLSVLILC